MKTMEPLVDAAQLVADVRAGGFPGERGRVGPCGGRYVAGRR